MLLSAGRSLSGLDIIVAVLGQSIKLVARAVNPQPNKDEQCAAGSSESKVYETYKGRE